MVSRQYEFGAYRLDVRSRMLFREGDHVALPPKVVELLVALVQAAGRAGRGAHQRATAAASLARHCC